MRQSVFGRALLVSGSESLLVERLVKERVQQAVAERPEAQRNDVMASSLEGHQLAEITGGSLLASDTVTSINDISGLDPSLDDALVDAATNPGPDLALVMSHPGGVKGKRLLERIKKCPIEHVEVKGYKPWELPNFVVAEGKRHKVNFSLGAAQALTAAIGHDLRSLAAAVDQLCSDAGGQEISEDFISRYFAGRAEVSSFAVSDAILAGNTAKALENLRWALETGVAPVLITSALANGLRSLGKYIDAKAARVPDRDLPKVAGVPYWKLRDLSAQAGRWRSNEVANAIIEVAKADAAVKGAATNPEYALERMVFAILHPESK